jgi:hypothetical protein
MPRGQVLTECPISETLKGERAITSGIKLEATRLSVDKERVLAAFSPTDTF